MQNVLTPDSVTQGILASIAAEGANPPSARQLASRLHVAPATLYGTVRSLDEAYSKARSTLAEQATGAVLNAVVRSESLPLCDLLSALGPQGLFLTDPRWPLGRNPMIEAALARVGLRPSALSDVLALVGSLLVVPGAGARSAFADTTFPSIRLSSVDDAGSASPVDRAHQPLLTPENIDYLIAGYLAAQPRLVPVDDADTPPASEVSEMPAADVAPVLAEVEAMLGSSGIEERRRVVRMHTARLVASPNPWSFRMLSDATGLAVSRLHRFGSRAWHLSQAVSDLAEGIVRLNGRAGADQDLIAEKTRFILSTGAADALAEVYHSSRTTGDKSIVDVPLPAPVVAVVVAHRTQRLNADESASIASELHRRLLAA